jgi:SH3-like domain-containing protein
MIRPILAAAFCLAASAAFAHPAMTGEDATMRAAPSSHARVVQHIPAHAQIDLGECGELWCEASWRDISGYLRVEAIAANDAPLGGPEPGWGYGYGWRRRW